MMDFTLHSEKTTVYTTVLYLKLESRSRKIGEHYTDRHTAGLGMSELKLPSD